jgi:hypothetical protein
VFTDDLESVKTELEEARSARDKAEAHLTEIAARRASLVALHEQAEAEAAQDSDVAIQTAGSETFAKNVARAVNRETAARFLGLAIARIDTATLPAAQRGALLAAVNECQAREAFAEGQVREHENSVKAELKRTAEVLGAFETVGLGERHEELLDALEEAQADCRKARQAVTKFEEGKQ